MKRLSIEFFQFGRIDGRKEVFALKQSYKEVLGSSALNLYPQD